MRRCVWLRRRKQLPWRRNELQRSEGKALGEPRKLWISGPTGRLEAMLRVAETPRALAVLAHPHPQFGGTMHNSVIFHSDRELHRVGLSTLRFNFRGTEESEGAHDGTQEVDDVAAAVSWLRGLAPDLPLLLVGYSFGAVCALRHAVRDPTVRGLIAIGLATSRYGYEEAAALRRPFAVVQGGADELADLDLVRAVVERAGDEASLHVVEGAGHLFPGQPREVAALVAQAAQAMLGKN